MQPSIYLQNEDYGLFGLEADTGIDDVIKASGLIDAYCQRPEGLMYDSNTLTMRVTGQPIKELVRVPFTGQVVFTRSPVVNILTIASWNGLSYVNITNRSGEALDEDSGFYVVPFNALRCTKCQFTYVAGYDSYLNLPFPVKQATANVIKAFADNCDMGGNIKSQKAGDAEIERFKDTIFDSDTRSLLGRWVRVA